MKQNSTIFGYVATLLCVLFFQFSSAQKVTVSDSTPGALSDYTFTYTLTKAYPANQNSFFNFNVDPSKNSAYVTNAPTPAGPYPTKLPVSLTADEVVVKVNGVVKTLTTDYTVAFSNSFGENYKVSITSTTDLSIGDEMEVTLKNVFNNPLGAAEYLLTWGTFHAAAPTEDLPYGVVETFEATYQNAI
ncbi:hypothetical protein ACFLRU_06855, partial [Bacteroidota bacterium]